MEETWEQKGLNKATMLVRRGIRVTPYCFANQWSEENNKKAKQREHETISLQALFVCLCIGVYDYAISSPIDTNTYPL